MEPATRRTLFLVAVAALVLWIAYAARDVVTPLVAALILAYILDPVVRALQRLGLSRRVASATVVVVAVVGLAAAAIAATNRLASEVAAFYDEVVGEPFVAAPTKAEALRKLGPRIEDAKGTKDELAPTTWDGAAGWYRDRNGDGIFEPGHAREASSKIHHALAASQWGRSLDRLLDGIDQAGPRVATYAATALEGLVSGGASALSVGLTLFSLIVLFPIYLYFSLVNLTMVYDTGIRYLPESRRARVVDILGKIHVTLSAFFRGRFVTMLVKWTLLMALFVATGVPFAFVCASFAAIASLVPVVGGVVGALPAVMLSIKSSTGTEMAVLIGLLVGLEILEAYVLIPALVGRKVGLHPLTVLVCTFVAGDLFGVFGMLVAIPLTAVVKILAEELVLPELRRRAGMKAPAAVPAPEPTRPGGPSE